MPQRPTIAEEMREFSRVATAIPVTMRWSDNALCQGRTRDISLRGLLLRSAAAVLPPPGSAVSLTMTLADPAPVVQATARVVRILNPDENGHAGCALEFTEINGEDSFFHLRQVVLYNAQDPQTISKELATHIGMRRIDAP